MREIELLDRQTVEWTAQIIGPQSASAQALKEADRRAKEGREVVFARRGTAILVVDKKDIVLE